MSDDEAIRETDKMHRDATMRAMRSTGWVRKVNLWFARFFDYVGTELREIQEDERRGKDDNYHNEY